MSRQLVGDPVPHNSNRLGYWLGIVFHPFVVFIPALVIVLKDTEAIKAMGWVTFIAAVILIPLLTLIVLARHQGHYVYQRETRHLLYAVFWASMVLCIILATVLHAPERLIFALLTLCVWVPMQASVNARFTKISAHTAVMAGIMTALFLMGDLSSPGLVVGAVVSVAVTGWARVSTGHHTVIQAASGVLVSVFSVFFADGLWLLIGQG